MTVAGMRGKVKELIKADFVGGGESGVSLVGIFY